MATNTASFPAINMALAIVSGIPKARVERNGSAVQRKTSIPLGDGMHAWHVNIDIT